VSPTFEAAQRSNLPERSAGVAMFYNQRYRSGRERGRFGNYLQVIRWAAVAGDRPDEGLSSAGQVADSVNLASAGMDFDPVLFMIEARWFSKVRWLGAPPRTSSMICRSRGVKPATWVAASSYRATASGVTVPALLADCAHDGHPRAPWKLRRPVRNRLHGPMRPYLVNGESHAGCSSRSFGR